MTVRGAIEFALEIALGLAKWAIKSPSLTIWMEDVQPDILFVVQVDLASF